MAESTSDGGCDGLGLKVDSRLPTIYSVSGEGLATTEDEKPVVDLRCRSRPPHRPQQDNSSKPHRTLLDKICETTTFATFITSIVGCGWGLAQSFRPGWWGSYFAAFWMCVLGAMLAGQAYYLYKKPHLSTPSAARYRLWLGYSCYMTLLGATLLVCYILLPTPSSDGLSPIGWWAFTWFPSIALALVYIHLHQRSKATVQLLLKDDKCQLGQLQTLSEGRESETHSQTSPAPKRRRSVFRQCGSFLLGALGWSTVFWAFSLGTLLAVQAVWQTVDHFKYPATKYGELVAVPILNTDYTPRLFIRCVGPAKRRLSTFVLEADAAAPAASLFGLQDALAAIGRRSCAYDRLGTGWSDDVVTPSHLKRVPQTLHSLLAAAGRSPPYIMVGHGFGGQLALQFATLYPELVSGLALMDTSSSTATHLQLGVITNHTDYWGNMHYRFTNNHMIDQLVQLNLVRAAVPLGLPRFVKYSTNTYHYQAEVNAMYGNRRAWQGAWAEYAAAVAAQPDSLDEQLTLAAPSGDSFWYGTGWKDFSPRPVLVMPARDTLTASAECDITLSACREALLQADGRYFAKQQLAYFDTLSNNASLAVMPGDYSYPWSDPAATASAMASKFAGV